MISSQNAPHQAATLDADFTANEYRALCRLALAGPWKLASYANLSWRDRFVLWRHDLDFSINRSLALARIEHQEGLKATYFVNIHSDFYNLSELGQCKIVKEILSLGHDLGLHFDATFYDVRNEEELERRLTCEAGYLQELLGAGPTAFSFHNPVAEHLGWEAERYGGLVNCYSKRFKTDIAYCSDSNGYWRFRRLREVLTAATDERLQVLTHPGWWQDTPMPPRQRVFRAAYGRAIATVRAYDQMIEQHGRVNHAGPAASLSVFRLAQPRQFELCDYLWNQGAFQTLFVELWRLHEGQINRLCKAHLRKVWRIPASEVNAVFGRSGLPVDGLCLFKALFGCGLHEVTDDSDATHQYWVSVRNQLIHARSSCEPTQLEQGCIYLTQVMVKFAEWGKSQPLAYDGLAHLGSIGLPTRATADGSACEALDEASRKIERFPKRRWEALKQILMYSNSPPQIG